MLPEEGAREPVERCTVDLGLASVRLDVDGVSFVPSRLRRARRAQQVSLPYATIARVSMTEPHGLARGTLTVCLTSGERYAVSYPTSKVREMRRTQQQIWRRSVAARDEGSARGD